MKWSICLGTVRIRYRYAVLESIRSRASCFSKTIFLTFGSRHIERYLKTINFLKSSSKFSISRCFLYVSRSLSFRIFLR